MSAFWICDLLQQVKKTIFGEEKDPLNVGGEMIYLNTKCAPQIAQEGWNTSDTIFLSALAQSACLYHKPSLIFVQKSFKPLFKIFYAFKSTSTGMSIRCTSFTVTVHKRIRASKVSSYRPGISQHQKKSWEVWLIFPS